MLPVESEQVSSPRTFSLFCKVELHFYPIARVCDRACARERHVTGGCPECPQGGLRAGFPPPSPVLRELQGTSHLLPHRSGFNTGRTLDLRAEPVATGKCLLSPQPLAISEDSELHLVVAVLIQVTWPLTTSR